MKKYMTLFKYEMKNIIKDPMNLFMLVFPILMLFICGYLLPAIVNRTADPTSNAKAIAMLLGFMMLLSVGGMFMGAMLGFALLDNRDENILLNIAVTPITLSGYAIFKIIYTYIFAVISNFIMIGGLKLFASDAYTVNYGDSVIGLLDTIQVGHIIVFSFVSALIVPFVAMLLAAFAKNKIEGFAYVKAGGIFIMIPMLLLLNSFQDGKQYIFAIFPNFWSMKALLNLSLNLQSSANLNFWVYMVIGTIYPILLGIFALKVFIKKLT
jgi:fluoroquinolone transport system permease protein